MRLDLANAEIEKLRTRLERTAARSGRRKTAFKQLLRTYKASQQALHLMGLTNNRLREENWKLRSEMARAKAIARKEFFAEPWWYRLFAKERV